MQAALLASLLFALVLIVTLRIRETAPEPVAERTSALAAERQTLTYIAPARPEAAEETPEELTVEPESENRYAELHFSDEDVYILGLASSTTRRAARASRDKSPSSRSF